MRDITRKAVLRVGQYAAEHYPGDAAYPVLVSALADLRHWASVHGFSLATFGKAVEDSADLHQNDLSWSQSRDRREGSPE